MIDQDIETLKSFTGSEYGKQFALSRVMMRMNLLCMWIRGCANDLVDQIATYDKSLKHKYPELYDGLADYEYLPGSGFKYIRKWRQSNYAYHLQFPILDRIRMAIGIRMRNLYTTNS
jgi:hypothetical protein